MRIATIAGSSTISGPNCTSATAWPSPMNELGGHALVPKASTVATAHVARPSSASPKPKSAGKPRSMLIRGDGRRPVVLAIRTSVSIVVLAPSLSGLNDTWRSTRSAPAAGDTPGPTSPAASAAVATSHTDRMSEHRPSRKWMTLIPPRRGQVPKVRTYIDGPSGHAPLPDLACCASTRRSVRSSIQARLICYLSATAEGHAAERMTTAGAAQPIWSHGV